MKIAQTISTLELSDQGCTKNKTGLTNEIDGLTLLKTFLNKWLARKISLSNIEKYLPFHWNDANLWCL